jgi:hypothetical protein
MKETVLFGLFPGVLIGIAVNVFRSKGLDAEGLEIYHVSIFFAYLFCNVVMASLAFYIILMTHRLNLVASAKVMQKNVASVTIVFCICHVPSMMFLGKLAFPSDMIDIPRQVFNFFLALNSCCNIFIYIALGKTFRTTLFNVLTECWQRGGRRGGGEGRRGQRRGGRKVEERKAALVNVTRV